MNNLKKQVWVQSFHAGHEDDRERKTEKERQRATEGNKKKEAQGCLQAIWPDQTNTGGTVGRQREEGTNQPPLAGSAKETRPGVEEEKEKK